MSAAFIWWPLCAGSGLCEGSAISRKSPFKPNAAIVCTEPDLTHRRDAAKVCFGTSMTWEERLGLRLGIEHHNTI